MTYFKVLLISVFALSTTLFGGNPANLEDAKKMATDQGKPILIDFYAVWCGPCKTFTKESKNDDAVKKALEQVVLFKIDSEKGKGPELAKSYAVRGYPTFVLINAKGEIINRWTGYAKDFFINSLSSAMKNPVPFSQKVSAFEKKPNATDAVAIAGFYASSGDINNAKKWYEKAEKLDPSTSYAPNLFELELMKMRQAPTDDQLKHFNELLVQAETAKKCDQEKLARAYSVMISINNRLGNKSEANEILKRAYTYGKDLKGPIGAQFKSSFYPLYLVHIEKDPAKGAVAFKEALPKDWNQSSQGNNTYAWWCFENGADLEGALVAAAKGVELAQPGREKAMILDTQAEIEYALGHATKALDLAKKAALEDPQSKHYPNQISRFEGSPKELP